MAADVRVTTAGDTRTTTAGDTRVLTTASGTTGSPAMALAASMGNS